MLVIPSYNWRGAEQVVTHYAPAEKKLAPSQKVMKGHDRSQKIMSDLRQIRNI